jgi:hypothetical protein
MSDDEYQCYCNVPVDDCLTVFDDPRPQTRYEREFYLRDDIAIACHTFESELVKAYKRVKKAVDFYAPAYKILRVDAGEVYTLATLAMDERVGLTVGDVLTLLRTGRTTSASGGEFRAQPPAADWWIDSDMHARLMRMTRYVRDETWVHFVTVSCVHTKNEWDT